jgi:hypothetical protein
MKEKSLQLGRTKKEKEVEYQFDESLFEHNLKQDGSPAMRMLAETMTMQTMPQPAAVALEGKLREMIRR